MRQAGLPRILKTAAAPQSTGRHSSSTKRSLMVACRLLPMQLGTAAYNMAVDQVLLESVQQGGLPTLRFYGWSQPTLSLGYFQPLRQRDTHVESRGVDCVRRSTGGGAIVHDHELTYSVALPLAAAGGGRDELYRRLHGAIAETLSAFGVRATPHRLAATPVKRATSNQPQPFLCFQRRTAEDLIVSGYKVLGSAQRRTKNAILQHGSLLLQSSCRAPQLPGIQELLGRTIAMSELTEALQQHFRAALRISHWEAGSLSQPERSRVESVRQERFADPAWLARR